MRPKLRIDASALLDRIRNEGAEAVLTRGEAAALIASVVSPSEDETIARNRIAMQLDRSQKKGNDVVTGGLARQHDGGFTIDEIARWAKRKYGRTSPRPFEDFPIKPRTYLDLASVCASVEVTLTDDNTLPGTLEDCHIVIKQLRANILDLKIEYAREKIGRNTTLLANLKGKKGD